MPLDPLSRTLDAWLELASRLLDEAKLRALDRCDDLGDVRGIAEHEVQATMSDTRFSPSEGEAIPSFAMRCSSGVMKDRGQ